MGDAGTYTLKAENRNGTDKVDLDLIVLDLMQDCECDMFKFGDFKCTCSSSFRYSSRITLLFRFSIPIFDFDFAHCENRRTHQFFNFLTISSFQKARCLGFVKSHGKIQ